jgi:hypothetical protein
MNVRQMKRPSPALVVAMAALLFALGGTAGAVVTAAVPLAKRALVADNAKKLGGQTAAQIASSAAARAVSQSPAGPRPASTVTGLTTVKSQSLGSVSVNGLTEAQIACDAGQTAIGGGISSDTHLVGVFTSYQSAPGTWTVGAGNFGDALANVTGYAVCLK